MPNQGANRDRSHSKMNEKIGNDETANTKTAENPNNEKCEEITAEDETASVKTAEKLNNEKREEIIAGGGAIAINSAVQSNECSSVSTASSSDSLIFEMEGFNDYHKRRVRPIPDISNPDVGADSSYPNSRIKINDNDVIAEASAVNYPDKLCKFSWPRFVPKRPSTFHGIGGTIDNLFASATVNTADKPNEDYGINDGLSHLPLDLKKINLNDDESVTANTADPPNEEQGISAGSSHSSAHLEIVDKENYKKLSEFLFEDLETNAGIVDKNVDDELGAAAVNSANVPSSDVGINAGSSHSSGCLEIVDFKNYEKLTDFMFEDIDKSDCLVDKNVDENLGATANVGITGDHLANHSNRIAEVKDNEGLPNAERFFGLYKQTAEAYTANKPNEDRFELPKRSNSSEGPNEKPGVDTTFNKGYFKLHRYYDESWFQEDS